MGIARSQADARYPCLWSGLLTAFSPSARGATGGTVINAIRHGRDGTLTNFALGTAWNRADGLYRILHDGSNDHIPLLATLMGGLAQWHVSMFLWNTSLGASASPFGDSLATFSSHPTVRFTSSKYQFLVGNGSSFFINGSTSGNATTSVREHLSFGYNGADLLVYRDGILTDTIAATDNQTLSASGSDVRIGGGSSASAVAYSGAWDDLLIHNRILSPVEVRLLATRRGALYETREPSIYKAALSLSVRPHYYYQQQAILTGF